MENRLVKLEDALESLSKLVENIASTVTSFKNVAEDMNKNIQQMLATNQKTQKNSDDIEKLFDLYRELDDKIDDKADSHNKDCDTRVEKVEVKNKSNLVYVVALAILVLGYIIYEVRATRTIVLDTHTTVIENKTNISRNTELLKKNEDSNTKAKGHRYYIQKELKEDIAKIKE